MRVPISLVIVLSGMLLLLLIAAVHGNLVAQDQKREAYFCGWQEATRLAASMLHREGPTVRAECTQYDSMFDPKGGS